MSGRVLIADVDRDVDRTRWATVVARLAAAGYSVTRSDPLVGPKTYYAERFGHLRRFDDLAAVERFAAHAASTP